MVYGKKFVMEVVSNGQIVHHKADNTVELPWGSEYRLRFINKNARRAVVKLFIDGEEQSKG